MTNTRSKLNISNIISINLLFLPNICFTYYYELLYFNILIAKNLRIILWFNNYLSYNFNSYLTKINPIYECWSIYVIFYIILNIVSKCLESLSIDINIFYKFYFNTFLGYCAALCYH